MSRIRWMFSGIIVSGYTMGAAYISIVSNTSQIIDKSRNRIKSGEVRKENERIIIYKNNTYAKNITTPSTLGNFPYPIKNKTMTTTFIPKTNKELMVDDTTSVHRGT